MLFGASRRGTAVPSLCYNMGRNGRICESSPTLESSPREQSMAIHQINPQNAKLAALDPIWDRVRQEAEDIVRREPELASFIYSTVLHHDRLEASVVHRIAERLDHSALSGDLIRQTYDEALRDDPDLGNAFRADLVAVYDRDPATSRFIDPLLYFKGFHALQTHRLAHWLHQKGRKDFAFYLQSRSSAVFQTDINPAAKIVGEAGCAEPSRTMDQMINAIGL